MNRYLFILHSILCSLAFPTSVKAQYYSVNYDTRTVAEMSAAFNMEAATEMYYAQQVAKIREHYQAAEVAAAFNLPANHKPSFLMPCGYAAEGVQPSENHFSRKPLSETVTYK